MLSKIHLKNINSKLVIKGLFPVGLIVFSLFACNPPEDFPTTPRITFNRVEFQDLENQPDSLIIYIDFEDGDGDLGLNRDENDFPYQDLDFIVDDAGKFVTLRADDVVPPLYRVTFGPTGVPLGSVDFSSTDNRPPFSCDDYDFIFIDDDRTTIVAKGTNPNNIDMTVFHEDTLYVVKNENRNNIFVDYFRKRNGEYEFIDWRRAFDVNGCGLDFNARFPIFDPSSLNSSLEGTIKYAMTSSGFNVLIRADTFKLSIRIKDRALNDSNVVETGDLTLEDLR